MINLLLLRIFFKFEFILAALIIFLSITAGAAKCQSEEIILPPNKAQKSITGVSHEYKVHFKHSDVIAFGRGSIQDYVDYGVMFVSWGGHPEPRIDSIERYREHVRDALSKGTIIGGKVGTKTDFSAFIDFAPKEFMNSRCIKVDGSPIIPYVMRSANYKGHPGYWFCTNSPLFRKFMKLRIERALKCGASGVMIDDPLGTAAAVLWKGGCYCESCISQFREYLKSNFTHEELAEKGIIDIESFNLKEFHAQYSRVPSHKRPLRNEIVDFQLKKSSEMFQEVTNYALKVSGKQIPRSGNINPCHRESGYLLTKVDYFSCEVPMGAKTGGLEKPQSLMAFKIADALHKPIAIMGGGGDHAFLQKNNLPGMLRCWISEAYAFGGYFMAPYWLWAYSQENGSHRYRPRHKSEFTPVYKFIKQHAYLFDDYEVVAKVALALSYKAYRNGSHSIEVFIRELANLNIPFEIVIAGDDVLRIHLTELQLDKYDVVIVPSDAILAVEDSATLKQYKADGGIIIDNIKNLNLSTQIQLIGAKKIRTTLRSVPGDLKRPIVVHLLNRDYDVETDSCRIKTDFTVRIPKKLLDGRQIQKVRYVRPNSWEPKKKGYFLRPQKKMPDVALTFETSDDYIEVKVPELDVWGIVVLSSIK